MGVGSGERGRGKGKRGKGKGKREILDCFIEYESLFVLHEFLEESEDSPKLLP
jgi:hypothetical protein